MRQGGEITGFEQVTKPYLLRYAGAKGSPAGQKLTQCTEEVTDALQNVMLQHADTV